MARFDRPCTTFYLSAIVTIALSFAIFELFDADIVTLKLRLSFVRYSVSNNGVTLKTGLWFVQGHLKWRGSIDHVRLFICPPL